MKKNILKVAFVAAIAVACGINVFNAQKSEALSEAVLSNVEALASVNPLCPNGCYKDGNGCYCNGWFETYKEAGPVI